jgi:hypothetical protein
MEQLPLRLSNPPQIDVDKMMDPKYDIIYLGKATLQFDGTWRCLANVHGALCLVEASIKQTK